MSYNGQNISEFALERLFSCNLKEFEIHAEVVCKIIHTISVLVHKWQFYRVRNERGSVATPNNFSIFNSYDMKSL